MKKIITVAVMLVVCLCLLFACAPKSYGVFYSLEAAYEQGLISKEDLESIAHSQGEQALSKKTEKAIKETWAYDLRNRSAAPIPRAQAKDVTVNYYYGTYNNCFAV